MTQVWDVGWAKPEVQYCLPCSVHYSIMPRGCPCYQPLTPQPLAIGSSLMGSKAHQAREWLASCIPSPFWDKYGTGLLGVIASINKFKKYWEYWVKGKNRQYSLSYMNFRIFASECSASRWEGNLLVFLLSILCCFSLLSQSLDTRVPRLNPCPLLYILLTNHT